jgi:prepilin-type N-terminal cleavage/methylation domain-containing protein/prepilin-type processing-associated H-X9-DG protein
MNHTPRKRSGFTLIELLTVIAIIGILAAVLFPGVQAVMKSAKRSAASTKLSNIAKSFVNFNNSGSGGSRVIAKAAWNESTAPTSANSIADYAAVLAYTVDLNDAEIWYVEADIGNESVASFPKQVLTGAVGSKAVAVATPSSTTGYISWAAYVPTVRNISSTTPIVWTRGLQTDGTWSATAGVWASEGGHVSFGDGHVTWYDNTKGQFIDRTSATGAPQDSWQKAIKSTAFTDAALEQNP